MFYVCVRLVIFITYTFVKRQSLNKDVTNLQRHYLNLKDLNFKAIIIGFFYVVMNFGLLSVVF